MRRAAGWSTKEMERLLYSSELDPFMASLPSSPIANVAEFILAAVSEAGDDRHETRRQSEDQARKLLDESAGHMTQEQGRALFALVNTDSQHGKLKRNRFSPAFLGNRQCTDQRPRELQRLDREDVERVRRGACQRHRRAAEGSQAAALSGDFLSVDARLPA